MTKYCNNESCSMYRKVLPDDAKFCPQCGEVPATFSSETSAQVSSKDNESNLTADYSTQISDSHDNIVNNSYSNDVVNKITNVYIEKSKGEQSLSERVAEYRKFCQASMRDAIISKKLRQELDEFAIELNLTEDVKANVEQSVKKSKSFANRESLSRADRVALNNTIQKICQNPASLSSIKENLAPFATSESDEAQFYHYMISAIDNPRIAISNYTKTDVDNYWQTFWVCFAYRKQGQNIVAKQTARKLQEWEEYPEDNINVAYCILSILDEEFSDAKNFLSHIDTESISEVLKPLRAAIYYITEYGINSSLSNSSECNFYLQKVFGMDNSISKSMSSTITESNQSPKSFSLTQSEPAPEHSIKAVHDAVSSTIEKKVELEQKKSTNSIKKNVGWIILLTCVVGGFLLFSPNKDKSEKVTENKTFVSTNNRPQMNENGGEHEKASSTSFKNNQTKTAQSKLAEENKVTEKVEKTEVTYTETAKEATKADVISILKASAETGDKDARFNLGMKYYQGDGVDQNYSTAFNYLKPLAEEGYDKAFFPVAEMYHGGRGVTKDRNEAEKWYMKAAKAGNAEAKRILMRM